LEESARAGATDPNQVLLYGFEETEKTTSKKLRGSTFRGVSLNGKKWQVMVMGNNCKYFSGSIPYERLAAQIYDRFAL